MSATNVITMTSRILIKRSCLFVTTLALLMTLPHTTQAVLTEEGQVGIEVVAILKTDELGQKLRYPSSVTYDRERDETYVIGGGAGKVIVYASNFFPIVSLGRGRGADAPRGISIHPSGMLYLCQASSEDTVARISSFNPAFFLEQEITFAGMPDTENFSPKKLLTGLNGKLYVAGQNTRGLLVLDQDGGFDHWLRPMDRLFTENSAELPTTEEEAGAIPELVAVTEPIPDSDAETKSPMNMRDLLPPDLLPTLTTDESETSSQELKPVQVADVVTDSEGHLYVLSEETSKIYVYSHNEELLFSFGQKGGSTGKMSRPKALALDEKKKALYVVDYMRHTILIFDLGGKFMYEFGGMGTGPGWFQYPVGLALNRQGNLIVADLFNQRVQILDIKFEYVFPLMQAPDGEQIPVPILPETPETLGTPETEETPVLLPQPIYL